MNEILKKRIGDKKEYRAMMARVKELPEDYQYVFEQIQKYMWKFAAGDGYDMQQVQYDLIDLFEDGAAEGKPILEVTGEDVASFADELLRNARTYTKDWGEKLNQNIMKKLGKKEGSQ